MSLLFSIWYGDSYWQLVREKYDSTTAEARSTTDDRCSAPSSDSIAASPRLSARSSPQLIDGIIILQIDN